LEAGDGALVTQDEAILDGPGDGALSVELPKGVRVEHILPTFEGALVERRLICAHAHRHSLHLLVASSGVAHREALPDKPRTFHN